MRLFSLLAHKTDCGSSLYRSVVKVLEYVSNIPKVVWESPMNLFWNGGVIIRLQTTPLRIWQYGAALSFINHIFITLCAIYIPPLIFKGDIVGVCHCMDGPSVRKQ